MNRTIKKPVLVVMAAGMGSRYGGLKQIDPIDEQGHIIMDFSLYDAKAAGFEEVIFIIKKEMHDIFEESIGKRMAEHFKVTYVYQDINNIPEGFSVPDGRVKPWGTGHAILSCMDAIDGPFAVINADDYYGNSAFDKIYQYLIVHSDDSYYRYAMVGYMVENTLTEHGSVARGVCEINENGFLTHIEERTRIEKKGGHAEYTEDDGNTWNKIPEGTVVSMNMWGFQDSMLKELKARFPHFLKYNIEKNPLKCEYFLPNVVGELLEEDKATVSVLKSADVWYGVTYQEDKPQVMKAIQKLKEQGYYPENLWK